MLKLFTGKYRKLIRILLILIIIIFSALSLFYFLKKNLNSENAATKIDTINRAENLLFEQYAQTKLTLTSSERFLKFIFENPQNFRIDSSEIIKITAQRKTGTYNKTFKLPSVIFQNNSIKNINDLTDKQLYINNVFCEIWQKSGTEFVRIASGKANKKNKYIFIENTEEPAKSVLNEGRYFKKNQYESDLKFISSFPVYYHGKIILLISLENNKDILSSFSQSNLNNLANFLIINNKGQIVFGSKGISNLPSEIDLHKNILSDNEGINRVQVKDQTIYFKYIPEFAFYIGFIPNNSESDSTLIKLKKIIFYIFFGLTIVLILLIIYSDFIKEKEQKNLIKSINSLLPKEMSTNLSPKEVCDSLKKYFFNINDFIEKIATENYETKPNKILSNDKLFNNLEIIQDTFLKNKLIESNHKIEQNLKKKFDKSALQISEILQYAENIEDLSYKIIKHISEFIGAEQIAFFLTDEDLQKNRSLRMTASYAYSKQRTTHKILSTNEGLIGRSYLEKKPVILTEIPDNYTFIESGFGFQKPNFLIIIPLVFNNDVQALIELGSINIIETPQIKFLEDIGENIASTVANLKHSKQTEILLKQTTEQSEQIEEQRKTLEEKINTHRKQNRNLDKQILQLIEIIDSIKSVSYLIEYDLKGNIMDISSKVINLFETGKEDFISKSHKDIILSKKYSEDYETFWDDLAANKTQYLEETLKSGNKEIKIKQIYVPIRNVRRKIYRILSIGTIKDNREIL